MAPDAKPLTVPSGSTPVPDPTVLTTQQTQREIQGLRDSVDRAIQSLREILESRLAGMDLAIRLSKEEANREIHVLTETRGAETRGLRELIETRLDGMDRAIKLLQDTSDKFPARMDEKIAAVSNLHEEKFSSIQVQFRERDVRTEQSSKDSKVAVDAALQAAKEAVGEQNKSSSLAISKSEASTSKQIDQMGAQMTATNKGIDDKIDDIKQRLTRIEGAGQGSQVTRSNNMAMVAAIVGVCGLGIVLLTSGVFRAPVPTPAPVIVVPGATGNGPSGTVTESKATTRPQ